MDIKKLQTTVVAALQDIKAQDIRVYDTVHLTSLFDRVAIASGTSNRQTKALAASVRDKVKEHGGTVLSVEGQDTGEWVLVDLGDMVVHIMQPTIRAYYRLEEIWGDKEVKLGAAKRTATRSAQKTADTEQVPKKAARHLTITHTEAAPKKRAPRSSSTTAAPAETAAAPKKRAPRKTGINGATAAAPVKKTVRRSPAASADATAVKRAAPTRSVKPAAKAATDSTSKPTTKRTAKPAGKSTAAKAPAKRSTKAKPSGAE